MDIWELVATLQSKIIDLLNKFMNISEEVSVLRAEVAAQKRTMKELHDVFIDIRSDDEENV